MSERISKYAEMGKEFFVRVNGSLDIFLEHPFGSDHNTIVRREVRHTYGITPLADGSYKAKSAEWKNKHAVYGSDENAVIGMAFAKSLREQLDAEPEDYPPWDEAATVIRK